MENREKEKVKTFCRIEERADTCFEGDGEVYLWMRLHAMVPFHGVRLLANDCGR